MSKFQTVRGFINQRLSAAAEEIFELVEGTIADYEEQLGRQQKLLDAVYNPKVCLHRADVQQLLVSTENVSSELKKRGLSLDQEDPPDPPHVKEEGEKLWSCQEMEQLHGLKEEETTECPLTPVPAKNEEEGEDPQSSQLDEKQEILHSESETDDSSYYLEESGKPQSGLNHVSDLECNTEETPVGFSEGVTSSGQEEPEPDATKIQNNKKHLSCSVCGKCFRKKSTLFRHQKTHTRDNEHMSGLNQLQNEEAPVSDVKCDTEKNPESSSECASSSDQKKEPQKSKEMQEEDRRFCCSFCNRRFTTRGNLNQHMSCHSSEKPFCCSLCGKIFVQKRYLKRHMVCHTGERPYSCSQCGKRFLKPSQLREHAIIHKGEKPYSCSVCDKRFIQKRYLKDHMIFHSGERPHSCSLCGKRFFKASRLKDHAAIHKGEKPFSCNVCDKRFIQKRYLKEHMIIHSGEKPYSCSLCGKRFFKASRLKEHAAIHKGEKPFSCNVCDKRFIQKRYLKEHMVCHSEEKKLYSCSQCGKRFSKPSRLKNHFIIHTREKPYSCSVCDKSFARSNTLKKHTCDAESSRNK